MFISIIHNIQNMGKTQVSINIRTQIYINIKCRLDKEVILPSETTYNTDEPGEHYAKWNQPEAERQIDMHNLTYT